MTRNSEPAPDDPQHRRADRPARWDRLDSLLAQHGISTNVRLDVNEGITNVTVRVDVNGNGEFGDREDATIRANVNGRIRVRSDGRTSELHDPERANQYIQQVRDYKLASGYLWVEPLLPEGTPRNQQSLDRAVQAYGDFAVQSVDFARSVRGRTSAQAEEVLRQARESVSPEHAGQFAVEQASRRQLGQVALSASNQATPSDSVLTK